MGKELRVVHVRTRFFFLQCTKVFSQHLLPPPPQIGSQQSSCALSYIIRSKFMKHWWSFQEQFSNVDTQKVFISLFECCLHVILQLLGEGSIMFMEFLHVRGDICKIVRFQQACRTLLWLSAGLCHNFPPSQQSVWLTLLLRSLRPNDVSLWSDCAPCFSSYMGFPYVVSITIFLGSFAVIYFFRHYLMVFGTHCIAENNILWKHSQRLNLNVSWIPQCYQVTVEVTVVIVVEYRLTHVSDFWCFCEHSSHLDVCLVHCRTHFYCTLIVVHPLAYFSSLQMEQNLWVVQK